MRHRVRQLLHDGQAQQAIDQLEAALARAKHDPALAQEVSVDLATTLYTADEFSRAAELLDKILPGLEDRDGGDDPAVLYLRYAAGVSHAEVGNAERATRHLNAYLHHTDPTDPLHRDAKYQRAFMLNATGHAAEALAELHGVRTLLVAEYGTDSIHVRALDRRIDQLRRHSTGG